MAKVTRSRHRSRARKPSPKTAPSQRHTQAASDLAQRDLLAGILDAALENGDPEKYLSQVVAHLGQYSECSCVGILLFNEDGNTACTSSHGSATQFQRTPRGSFPGSETCICSSILKGRSNTQPADSTEGGAFFRNSKPDASVPTEMAVRAFGICTGSTFESVAIIPVKYPETVVGFILVGDEGQDKIPLKTVKFLERVGTYVGSAVRSLESQDKVRQSEHGLPGPAEKTATASHDSDEMELLVRLIDNANESIVISQDWRIIYVNNKCAEMAGLSKQNLIGLAFLDITHPDDRPAVKERYSKLLSGEWLSDGISVRGFDKDGNTRWAELREIPFSWHGRPAIASLVNDITDRKRAEEALAQSERKYRQLVETVSEGIWVVDKDANTVFVNPRMAEMMGYTVEEMTGKHLLSLVTDKRGAEIAERKLESRRQGIGERYEAEAIRKDGTKIHLSVCASPILDDDGKYAGSIAGVQDVTDRIQAEEALRDSERHYRFLADNTTDVIWVTDMNLKPSYFSPSVTNLMGYTVEEAMDGTLETRVTPTSAEVAAKVFAQAITREKQKPGTTTSQTMEVELKHKDGSTVWVETTVSFMRDSKRQAVGVLGTMRDVTERRRAQEALKASEINYRNLFEHTLLGLEVVDMQTSKVVLSNRSMAEMFGFKSTADMVGTNPMDYVLPEDREWVASQMVQLMTEPGWHKVAILRSRTEDGRIIWITGLGAPIDYEGRPSMLLSLIDTTAAKLAQDKLQESELKNRLLIENATEGIVVLQDGLVKFANPKGSELVGRSGEELTPTPFLDFIHPDDRQMMMDNHVKRLAGEDVPNDYTFRMIDKQGNARWIQINAVRLDWEGKPAILAMLTDITDRKQANEALKASEERFRTIIENARDAITIVDENFSVIYESPSLAMVTGYTPEEWLGKSLGDMAIHPDDIPMLASKFELLKSQPGSVTEDLSVRYKHRDGSWHVIEASGRNLLHDPRVNGVVVNFRDITARRRMEEALRESEHSYRLLAENVTDVIWTTNMGLRVTYMSPSGVRLVGFSQEEYLNMTLEDMLTPSSFQDGMRAFAEQQAISSARQDTSPPSWTLEVQLRCKDGSTIWVEETVTFLCDQSGNAIGLLGVTRDIRERKKAEEALRISEGKHRTLVEASPDGVLSIDSRGIITDCNTGLCRMLGYEKEELRGKEARSLGTRKDLDAEAYYNDPLLRGEFLEVETEILRRDGQTLPVWAKLVRLDEPNTADIQTVIYFRDMADRRKIDEMKDEFVGLVSHELRSPLTVIIGALHTAISEGPRLSQKETRQLLEDAAFEAEQLSHLVGNLLELSRAQANRLFLHVEPVNLAKAAHKVIESIERQSPKHKFIVDLPRKLPPVSADQLRLERILYNLLENGVKYSPEGSEIRVSAKRDAGHLVVSVSDQGLGISKEDQAKLFKPFQQLGNPMLDHTKGAGLGLLVCRRLVEAHGGRIWIESEPGHGATFHFTLLASTKDSPDAG
jgi:PAS domain S-box-containing protein